MASFRYWSKIGQNLVASSAVRVMFCAMICLRWARRSARSISMSWSLMLFACASAPGALCAAGCCAACWPMTDTLHTSNALTTTRTDTTLFFIFILRSDFTISVPDRSYVWSSSSHTSARSANVWGARTTRLPYLVSAQRRTNSRISPHRWKTGLVLRELKFLRREVAILAGVNFPLPGIRRHAAQGPNYILHFSAERRKRLRGGVWRPVVARGRGSCVRPATGSSRRVSRVVHGRGVRARSASQYRRSRNRSRCSYRGVDANVTAGTVVRGGVVARWIASWDRDIVWRVSVVIGIVRRRIDGSVSIGVCVSPIGSAEVEAKSESESPAAVTIARIPPVAASPAVVASAPTIVSAAVIATVVASAPTIVSTAVIAAVASAVKPTAAVVSAAAPAAAVKPTAAVTTTLCKNGLWSRRERGQHNCRAKNSQYDGFIHFYTS